MKERRELTEEERLERRRAARRRREEEKRRKKRFVWSVVAFLFLIVIVVCGIFSIKACQTGNPTVSTNTQQTTVPAITTKPVAETTVSTEGTSPSASTEVSSETTTEAPTTETTTAETTTAAAGGNIGTPKAHQLFTTELAKGADIPVQGNVTIPSWIQQILLTENSKGRPMTPLNEVKHVVIHYTATPDPTVGAGIIRDNFQENDPRAVSAHFVVGVQGEIVQCVPVTEVAFAQGTTRENLVNHNFDSISIENCHPDESGEFTHETYESLVYLTAWLLEEFHLSTDALMRHYDATSNLAAGIEGKACPKSFVEHPEEWEQFKQDVADYMVAYPNIGQQFP